MCNCKFVRILPVSFRIWCRALVFIMSGNYEQEQARLLKLWNNILSDEEQSNSEPFEASSSDEYAPDTASTSSSEDNVFRPKRMKK